MQQTSPPPFNPYHSPSAPASPGYASSGSVEVSARTISELNGTRPWVKVLSLVAWIGSGLMVIAGLAMTLMGFLGIGAATAPGQGLGIGVGLFYLLFAALMIYPALKISAYGKKIDDLGRSQSVQDLEIALEQQRLVWRFYGVLAVIYFCVIAVAMLVAVLLPLLMK